MSFVTHSPAHVLIQDAPSPNSFCNVLNYLRAAFRDTHVYAIHLIVPPCKHFTLPCYPVFSYVHNYIHIITMPMFKRRERIVKALQEILGKEDIHIKDIRPIVQEAVRAELDPDRKGDRTRKGPQTKGKPVRPKTL